MLVCLTKSERDYSSTVDNFVEEFERRAGAGAITVMNPETIEGESFATAHDILEFPAIVAVDGNGTTMAEWKGLPLPSYDEVSYYAK